jgi:hypothetical protein
MAKGSQIRYGSSPCYDEIKQGGGLFIEGAGPLRLPKLCNGPLGCWPQRDSGEDLAKSPASTINVRKHRSSAPAALLPSGEERVGHGVAQQLG